MTSLISGAAQDLVVAALAGGAVLAIAQSARAVRPPMSALIPIGFGAKRGELKGGLRESQEDATARPRKMRGAARA